MKHKTILKIMAFIITFATTFTTIGTVLNATNVHAETVVTKTELQTTVESMIPGWNLSGALDAYPSESSWGMPITTKALIEQIAASGFKSIRIPITWNQRIGAAPDYKIDAQFMARVKEVVDWSLESNLYVIINFHHDSSQWINKIAIDHDNVITKYNNAWTQISDTFKDYPTKLMFESINEPCFSTDWSKDDPAYFSILDEINTSFYGVVRKSGGNNDNRPLLLPSITCGTSQTRLDELNKTITKLNDKNIIATIHYYGYWQFSVNIGGVTTFNADAKTDIIQNFDRVYSTLVSKGIPVIAGEYGLLGFDKSRITVEGGETLKYFEYVNYYAKHRGITTMLWDNGRHFDRKTLKWTDEEFLNVINASAIGRSSNGETNAIYIKKGATIKDANIQLNLNGNNLSEVKIGSRTLVKSTDYDIINAILTIKSTLLQSIVTKNIGINSTLTCTFSSGANWNINVIYCDTPVLINSTGTTDAGLLIPTSFNGNKLATMESTYIIGGNTNPNKWTSFKEFETTFSPLYASNNIQLTSTFLKAINEGDILLKMHFWNGEIVKYTITKNGTSIVGVGTPPIEQIIYGDLNNDKVLNILDYILIKKYMINNNTNIPVKAADLNGDTNITVADSALLKSYLLHRITKFPVEN